MEDRKTKVRSTALRLTAPASAVALFVALWSGCNADRLPPTSGNGNEGGQSGLGGNGGATAGDPLRLEVASNDITVGPAQTVFLQAQPFGGQGQYELFWTQTKGTTVLFDNARSVNPSFTSPTVSATETLEFEVTVSDATSATVTETVKVTVEVPDVMAEAGAAVQVSEGQTAALHGAATGGTGTYNYSWTQTGGTPVTLSGAQTINPTFIAPQVSAAEALTFELSVESGGSVATDEVTVQVLLDAIVVSAGADQDATEAATVKLRAFGSGGGDTVSYTWSQKSGTPVVLTNTKKEATFVAPLVTTDTTLVFEVIANDGIRSVSDEVSVTVHPNLPVVFAGDDAQALENQVVQLTGDVRGGFPPYSYSWSQSAGTSVSLSQATTAAPQFGAPDVSADETLTFELAVTDSVGHVVSDALDVLVLNSPTQSLVAEAGPSFRVFEGGLITISGAALGGTAPYAFGWSQPDTVTEPALALSSPAGQPQVLIVGGPAVDSNQLANLALNVTDSLSASASDTVTCAIQNISFAASAGTDTSAIIGETVLLNAQATEARGTVAYTWTQSSGPTVPIANAHTQSPTFVPSQAGTYVFAVTAKDSINTASDEVTVTINAPTLSADAGVDQTVNPQDAVYLHALAGMGVGPYAFEWTQSQGPVVPLANATTSNPLFVAPLVSQATTLIFDVKITDGAGTVATDSVQVQVVPVPLIVQAFVSAKVAYGGTTISLNSTVSGGVGPLRYEWVHKNSVPPLTIADPQAASTAVMLGSSDRNVAGSFVLEVTDSGGVTVTSASVLVQVLLAPVVTIPGALIALQCGNSETLGRGQCSNADLSSTPMSSCPVSKPFAMSTVYQGSTFRPNTYYQYHRCVDETECRSLWYDDTRKRPECNPFNPRSTGAEVVCHYCCTTDGCNRSAIPAAETLYAP